MPSCAGIAEGGRLPVKVEHQSLLTEEIFPLALGGTLISSLRSSERVVTRIVSERLR